MNKLFQLLFVSGILTCTQAAIANVDDTQKKDIPAATAQQDNPLNSKNHLKSWATRPVQVCAKNQTNASFHMQLEGEKSPSFSSDICDSESSCGSSYRNSGPDYPPGPSSEARCVTLNNVSQCCDLIHTRFWVYTPHGNVLGCDPHDNIPSTNWPDTPTLNYTLYSGDDVPDNCVRGQGGFCCVLED